VIQEIGAVFAGTDKTVSVQTNPHSHNDYQAIVEEGRKLAKLSPNFVIKMPCTEDGFRACKILHDEGIRTNLTLCFSAMQALQAMRMGAFIVSPFIGWKETNGEEVWQFIHEIMEIKLNYGYTTEVLVAAIRNGRQIVESAVAGADIVTCAYAVYKEALEHPYTDMGLGKFQGFWDETPYE
jgi:transaldolase